ncbi:DUF6682 family protein [Endozoicomonas sp. ALB091]|uniref:phage adaptor protein n=1 Tax=Endozoicomonas sp. ALB091 TaxID=3403073 RepID=UPI003BB59E1B
MLVSELLVQAQAILNDNSAVTYTEPQLLNGIHLACNVVSLHRPDASTLTGDIALVAGAAQSLPAGGLRVVEALGNVAGDHTRIVDKQALDAADPGWRSGQAAAQVMEVVVDELTPGTFWVNPPNDGNGSLTLIYTSTPAMVVSVSDPLPVSDKYAQPVLEWLLYLMFSRDSERSPNKARATEHYQAFFNLLGIKTTVDAAFSPKMQRQN